MSDSPVRIGYGADFAPFTFTRQHQAAGTLIELVEAAFGRCGLQARFVEVPGPEVVERLSAGSIDAYAAMAVSPERRRHLRFSRVLASTGGAWFLPRNRPRPARGIPGSIVATPAGGPLIPIIRKRFVALTIIETPDYRSALASAASGTADAAALNLEAGWHQAQQDFPALFHAPEGTFCRASLALALPVTRPSPFIAAFNTALAAMK